MTTLQPGTYRLTRDVVNPHPDRRVKNDWTKVPVWPSGTFLIVKGPMISLVGDRYWILNNFKPGDDAYNYLSSAMQKCEETLEAMFTRLDVHTSVQYFFKFMVESGKWTMQDVEVNWTAYQEAP